MKKVIRKGVFETNSSSCHRISILGPDNYVNEKYGEYLDVYLDGYGWGPDELFGVYNKLSYVITSIQYYDEQIKTMEDLLNCNYFIWLKEMVYDYTGSLLEVNGTGDSYSPIGYVDHDSTDILSYSVYEYIDRFTEGEKVREGFWSDNEETFKDNMKELIFNSKYYIIIDNDNW